MDIEIIDVENIIFLEEELDSNLDNVNEKIKKYKRSKKPKISKVKKESLLKRINIPFGIITIILLTGATFTLNNLNVERTTKLIALNKNQEKEEQNILQTNERDQSKRQLKIMTDEINIRSEANASSTKLGKVVKDEIYDVINLETDDYYYWYEIKTSTGIKGFIATYRTDVPEFKEHYLIILPKKI